MAVQQSIFLNLPAELRICIYREYLLLNTEDGYVYDYAARKLRTANGQPIILDLMYTCRLVAQEMRGMPLRLHTVTFSTVYSEDVRGAAGLWARFMEYFHEDPLYQLDDVVPLMSDQMAAEVGRRYSGHVFYQVFRRLFEGNPARTARRGTFGTEVDYPTFGEVPSAFRDMARGTLELALSHPDIWRFVTEVNDHDEFEYQLWPASRFWLSQNMWQAPTPAEADCLAAKLNEPDEPSRKDNSYWYRRNEGGLKEGRCDMRRFSAAAAAIDFLTKSPPSTRAQFRNIVLHEDRVSVAYPECHMQGLVPFCDENPQLRIERRVNLWRNIFMTTPSYFRQPGSYTNFVEYWTVDRNGVELILEADTITQRVAEYMVEAARCAHGAMTLVLDGDPLPALASHIFSETVQRDAAWQTALDRAFSAERGADPHDVLFKRNAAPYHYTGFPELLREMSSEARDPDSSSGRSNNSSSSSNRNTRGGSGTGNVRIRCNFDPGESWSDARIEAEIERPCAGADLARWEQLWARGSAVGYQTEHPLPKYDRMFEENVLCTPFLLPRWRA